MITLGRLAAIRPIESGGGAAGSGSGRMVLESVGSRLAPRRARNGDHVRYAAQSGAPRMSWNVSYLPDADAILTVYSGAMTPAELVAAVGATIALGTQQGTRRFLADCTGLAGGHSIVDLYDLAKLIESTGLTRDAREAIVLPQLAAPSEDVRFWETTCRNRGFDVRVFDRMDVAGDWLSGSVSLPE